MNTFLRTLTLGVSFWAFMNTVALAAAGDADQDQTAAPARALAHTPTDNSVLEDIDPSDVDALAAYYVAEKDQQRLLPALRKMPADHRLAFLTATRNLGFDKMDEETKRWTTEQLAAIPAQNLPMIVEWALMLTELAEAPYQGLPDILYSARLILSEQLITEELLEETFKNVSTVVHKGGSGADEILQTLGLSNITSEEQEEVLNLAYPFFASAGMRNGDRNAIISSLLAVPRDQRENVAYMAYAGTFQDATLQEVVTLIDQIKLNPDAYTHLLDAYQRLPIADAKAEAGNTSAEAGEAAAAAAGH